MTRKKKISKDNKVDLSSLEQEILYFIKCVNLGLYAGPNRVISKQERSRWRFKVKKYYKDLNSYEASSESDKAYVLTKKKMNLFKRK